LGKLKKKSIGKVSLTKKNYIVIRKNICGNKIIIIKISKIQK